MFSLVSGLYDYLFSPPTVKVGLFGLNGAGKSVRKMGHVAISNFSLYFGP